MSRLAHGGLIDRSQSVRFSFEGSPYTGWPGDTLASALLANGVKLYGRSFKYHRPRGVFSAGPEEPNALVTLGRGALAEPNTRATTVELTSGLEAYGQNRFPSLGFDVMGVLDRFAPMLPAGFYYKTFMWPASLWERLYEPLIRQAAGLGRLSDQPDPTLYEKGFLHTDVLVVGGGAAGLMAALTAARAGARVILADEDFRFGGRLLAESHLLNDAPAPQWVDAVLAELASLPKVRLLPRTTVFGVYDHGVYGAVERHGSQVLWQITAKRGVLAAGAIERHIPFRDNDRPGVMLAGAIRAYVNRWAVLPYARAGDPAAIFTNNDDGHRTALDLMAHGVPIAAVIDTRAEAQSFGDYRLIAGGQVTGSRGRHGLTAIQVRNPDGEAEWLACALLGVAGGWNPTLHLTAHHRGRPRWSDEQGVFLPGPDGPPGLIAAGGVSGEGTTGAALASGGRAAAHALGALGYSAPMVAPPRTADEPTAASTHWHVPGKGRAWVDLQNDVTVKDIALAHRENMRSVEHLKRWTTLGMATDQGKTSNVTALAIMAELTGATIADTGTTVYRPPYTPVAIGALGEGDRGPHFRPTRRTPTHTWAERRGAVFVESGLWLRAQYYPLPGEDHWRQSVDREALAVRADVGVCDVSTLGKIDVQGADAGTFINRIYCNAMGALKPGRVRYGLMLRPDGLVQDDGTCARLGPDHYVITTTTANAGLVFRHLEFARQCLWPELDVHLISTTDAWAQLSIAGPRARALLTQVVDGTDLSNAAFPFMACAAVIVCGGMRARLFRISFSGELAYELAVPARYGAALMERLCALGATPYGIEALGVLRIEKGHPVGAELNGQTTALMLGLGRMVSTKKDAIGSIMSEREGLRSERRRLVGLMAADDGGVVTAGAHLFSPGAARSLDTDQGWISSACWSPHLGCAIGLGFLEEGDQRHGEIIIGANPLEQRADRLRITDPVFIDPEGARTRV